MNLSWVPPDFSYPEQISWSWYSCRPRHSPHCQYSPASCGLSFSCHPSLGRMNGCFHFHDCLCSGRKKFSCSARQHIRGLWQLKANGTAKNARYIRARIHSNTDRQRKSRVQGRLTRIQRFSEFNINTSRLLLEHA